MSETEILTYLKRIDTKLTALLGSRKQTWVSVTVVKQLTGWEGREKLRWARANGLVEYNKKKGYLLESIPEQFIIKKITQ